MIQRWKRGRQNWVALLDLFACMAGFGVAVFGERMWFGPAVWNRPGSWVLRWCLSALISWLVIVYPERQRQDGVRLWIDSFLAITGTNLVVQCGLTYLWGIPPASWSVIILGSVCTILFTTLLRAGFPPPLEGSRGILMVGFDRTSGPLSVALQDEIVGGVELKPGTAPPSVEVLGGAEQMNEICASRPPQLLMLGDKPDEVPFRQLLQLHYAGIDVEGAPAVYERVLKRVAWEQLPPGHLLFFLNPNTSPAMLAFQAIYKNLLGLTLRVIFAPLLIVTSLLIVAFTGGPALEHVECLGFRRIPFQLLRFRTCRADGTLSRIGSWIERLHLTNLPHLMNLVRGEMTLFGPAPVRRIFAERLQELIPAYAYRFTVKPGIFGWPDAVLEKNEGLTEETLLLELDFYYVRQESPSLDLDILLRMLFRKSPEPPRATVPDIARNS